MREKTALRTVEGTNLLCLMQRCVCIGVLLLLFLPFATSAQQTDLQERLQQGIKKAERLLQQVRQQKDSLQSLPEALQDSVVLQTKLDSLRLQYPDSTLLAQKSDSRLQAFLKQEKVQAQLQEAESKLEQEIGQAREKLKQQFTPKQTQEALGRLEAAGNSTEAGLNELQKMTQAPELPELGQLQDKLPNHEELQKLTDREALEGQLREEVNTIAQDQLARQQGKLKQAGTEPSQYQERFKKLGSVKGLPKDALKIAPYKDKPWQERVVLGSLWQFSHQERYNIDFGPSLAWRFTEKLSAGAGFQYRLSVSMKEKPWLGSPDKVLGYFAFSDYEVKKGFFGRLYYENLNTPVPRLDATGKVEEVGQEWVKGLSVGVGKNYTIYKRIQGYTLVQYNVLHQRGQTPYLRPLQAKIGFYINGRKASQKVDKP